MTEATENADEPNWWVKHCPHCGRSLVDSRADELAIWNDYETGIRRAQVRCKECGVDVDLIYNRTRPDEEQLEEIRERRLRQDRSTV